MFFFGAIDRFFFIICAEYLAWACYQKRSPCWIVELTKVSLQDAARSVPGAHPASEPGRSRQRCHQNVSRSNVVGGLWRYVHPAGKRLRAAHRKGNVQLIFKFLFFFFFYWICLCMMHIVLKCSTIESLFVAYQLERPPESGDQNFIFNSWLCVSSSHSTKH